MDIRRYALVLLAGLGALLAGCGGAAATPSLPAPTSAVPTSAAAATAAPTSAAPAPTDAPAATPAPGGDAPGGRTLSLQDPPLTGEDVRVLQQRLLDLGYRAVGAADGVFGPQTEAAVRTFQTINGLSVDGVVGPQTWQRLQAAEATAGWAVAPLATELCGEHLLLGASYGQAWFDNATAGALLRGGERYRAYAADGALGEASGSAPQQGRLEEPPLFNTFFVTLEPAPPPAALALGGQWEPLPRPATVISGTPALDAYAAVVRDFLRERGVAEPTLSHSPDSSPDRFVVWRADLDGDGTEEALINAEHLVPNEEAPGEYSLVLLLAAAGPALVVGDVHPAGVNDFDETSHRAAALLDANGDGTLEALVSTNYFESAGVSLHGLAGPPSELLSVGCGV